MVLPSKKVIQRCMDGRLLDLAVAQVARGARRVRAICGAVAASAFRRGDPIGVRARFEIATALERRRICRERT